MSPPGPGLDLGLALAAGLLGSFGHCAAMCGPIAAAVGLSASPGSSRGAFAPQLLYNAGRITTYAVAGAVMGFAGSVVNVAGRVAGLQQAVSLGAGVLLVAMGLSVAGLLPWAAHLEARLAGRVFGMVRGRVRAPGQAGSGGFALGLLLGLLPCGLSWSAFVGSAATGGALPGALFALAFGLGTAPALLLVGGAAALASARLRGLLRRVGGIAVVALGLLFLLRGLGMHAL